MGKQVSNQSTTTKPKLKKGHRRPGFFMDDLEGVALPDRPSRARQKQNWRNLVDAALIDEDD